MKIVVVKVNLSSCRIGIFANINASERMTIQKIGRILRHPNPILIIPYYESTREEELVKRIKENYSSSMITKIMPDQLHLLPL